MREDDPTNFWRLALGYLNAELGHIGEAVKLFEGVEFSDELGPEAYRALANWYLVLNRKEGHDRALIRTYLTMDEYNVSRWLGQRIYPWRHAQQNPPSEVDKEILAAFAALFEKASHPRQHQHLLHDAYRSTRDFRLLAAMADAVVGHSAGKIYPFLEGMQPIIGDVRDEATVDELLAHAQKVRGRAKSAIDRRAIDLLEMMVLRRAAEIKNQPGPHIKGAVQALQRAFDREWTPGEHRYVASLLANLGTITAPELRKEQLDRIVQLYAVPKRGEYDRLVIGHSLAGLHWNYNRKNEAIDLLGAVIVEYRDANGGKLLNIFQTEFATLISYQEQMKRFAAGETLVLHELKATVNPQVGFWLKLRLFESYARALEQGGAVSLGEGAVLYRALEQRLREEMASHDMSYRDGLVSRLCQVYRTAHVRNIMSVAEDLRRFAFKEIHGLLAKQTSGHSNIRSQVSETVRELLGAHDAVLFVVEQIEREPAWFRLTGQDGWYQLGYRAARWRSEAEKLDQALEGRLLKIVLNELRDDLLSGRSRNREMYHHNHGYYWKDKEDDFVRVAEQVLTKVQNSGAAVQYVADYFYWGVQRYDRAIAVLFAAHQKKLLDEGGRAKLVDFLHRQSRYGESIPILEPLIVRSPKHMTYRALLMHAYFRTRQHEKLVALLKETDKLFRTPGLWVEPHIAALAGSTLDNELYKESVAYWNEVIPLHQRTAPNRGVGRGTLSHYYGQLGRAYAGLGKTPEAVDAASAAVVSWGSRHTERSRALESLRDVLRRAPDLDAYVVHLDKQASEAKHDYPIIRKAIGEVYAEKQQFQKAIAQFRIAVELQPNDAETHAALVAAHDKAGDPLGAIAQLKESVKLSRRDLKLYEDLGKRYEKERDATEAERAYTSLVEVMPLEAEGHAALAEVREKQGRLAEAAAEWEHVARLRALEPTGLLRLAGVQIKLRQFDEARETLKKLRGKTWPIRFEKLDEQIEKLDTELRKAKAQ
jgi:tetratricopeptide (TPR) repeat protein